MTALKTKSNYTKRKPFSLTIPMVKNTGREADTQYVGMDTCTHLDRLKDRKTLLKLLYSQWYPIIKDDNLWAQLLRSEMSHILVKFRK